MKPEEFHRILKLGLGRAILHLQKHNAAPYRDVILHACLHHTQYDYQIEGSRAVYMLDILNLIGEKDFYHRQILDAARADDNDNDRDTSHVLDLVQQFAEHGDAEARQILYDIFNASLQTEHARCDWRIIDLEGLAGFVYVADKLGAMALNQPDFEWDAYPLRLLEDALGKTELETALASVRQENANIDAYLKVEENEPKHIRQPIPQRSYAQVKELIQSGARVSLRLWGKNAEPIDLMEAARDLISVLDDEKRLQKYLEIFSMAVFPLDPNPLLPFTEHPNRRIWARTFTVLQNISHPVVREFALQLIRKNQQTGRAAGLFNRNFQEGDWAIMDEITRCTLEVEDHHSLQISIKKIFEEHPSPEAAAALLNTYEYAPCSFCREEIVEQLFSINALSKSLQEECRYDSNLDIRALAARGFQPEK